MNVVIIDNIFKLYVVHTLLLFDILFEGYWELFDSNHISELKTETCEQIMTVDLGLLQLGGDEATIYRKLLVSGQLSRSEIIDSVNIDINTVDATLSSLEEKNLIRKIPGMDNRYASLLPIGSTKDELEQAAESVEILGREVSDVASAEMTRLREELEKSTNELKQKVDDEVNNINTNIDSIRDSVQSSRDKTIQTLDTKRDTQQQQVTEQVNTQSNEISQDVSSFKSTSTSRVDSKRESVTRTSQAAIEKQKPIVTEAKENLRELDLTPVDQTSSELVSKINAILSSTQDSVADIKQQLADVISGIDEKYQIQLGNIKQVGKEYLNSSIESLNSASQSFNQQVEDQNLKFSELETQLDETTNQLQTTLNDVSAKTQSQQDSSKQVIEKTQTSLVGSVNEIKTTLEGTTDEVSNRLNSLANQSSIEYREHIDSNKEKITGMLNSITSSIQQQLQQKVNEFIEATQAEMNQNLQHFQTQISEEVQTMHVGRDELKESIQSDISAKITNLKETNSTKLNNQERQLSANYSALIDEISEQKVANQQVVQTALSGSTSTMTGIKSDHAHAKSNFNVWAQSVEESITNHIENQNSIFQTKLNDLLSNIRENIQQSTQSSNQSVGEMYQSVNAQLQDVTDLSSQQINQAVESVKATLSTFHQNLVGRLNTALEKMKNEYQGLIKSNKSDGIDLISNLQQDINVITEDLSSRVEGFTRTLNDQLSGLVDGIHTNFSSYITESHQKLINHISETRQISNRVIKSVSDLSSQGTDSQLETVQQTFDTYNEKYRSTAGQVSEKASALARIMDNILRLQQDTDTPELKTTHIVSKSAIISYMADMISRVKSKMTILVPEISMIDDDKILGLPMTSQITIVSAIDKIDDRDWIDKMHGATANVTLRTLTEQGFGAQLPDFIGCEREGEEIIIGTVDEGNNDYVAIASNSENFVRIFGSQVISEYSRGRSRQLQK